MGRPKADFHKPCATCGNMFQVKPSKASQRTTCSKECSKRRPPVSKNCAECGKEFQVKGSHAYRRLHCSKLCKSKFDADRMLGNEFNDGSRRGVLNNRWKGDDVGYHGLHSWISEHYGIPDHCELCGSSEKPPDSKNRWFQWSNRDGVYTRDRNRWWMLCPPCHEHYDRTVLKKTHYIKEVWQRE